MKTTYISAEILQAMIDIRAAGHGVELSAEQTGGNSHTNTFLTICCRRPGEAGNTKRLIVKHTSSYSGKFSEFSGVSDEFGEARFWQDPDISRLVKIATEIA